MVKILIQKMFSTADQRQDKEKQTNQILFFKEQKLTPLLKEKIEVGSSHSGKLAKAILEFYSFNKKGFGFYCLSVNATLPHYFCKL